MTRGTDNDLMRLLHGELPPEAAQELRGRMLRDPGLAADYRRLEQTWNGLSLPPAAPPPAGFSGRVMAHVRSQAPGRLSWSAAPRWVRATAAAALVAGAVAGIEVGRVWPAPEAPQDSSSLSGPEFNLAESYWGGVEDATAPAAGPAGTEVRR
jgi:anti-sigma factor RsiW